MVDPAQSIRLDAEPGLLEDFADDSVLHFLPGLEHATRWLPVPIVATLGGENPPIVPDDGAGDAHGVAVAVTHDHSPDAYDREVI